MNENLEMIKGDTFSFTIEIDGLTTNLDSCYFSCKKNKDDTDYVFKKSLNDGIELLESGTNSTSYKIRVAPEDTEDVEEGNYYYDLQIGVDNDIFTPLLGVLTLHNDVTREV